MFLASKSREIFLTSMDFQRFSAEIFALAFARLSHRVRLAAALTLLALSAGTFFIFSTQPQCSAVEHSHKFDSDII
jgi:hypothetical protein